MAGARVAYEQLLHDQIELTHLSTFLADIYREHHSMAEADFTRARSKNF